MAPRKSQELTIRLAPSERGMLVRAAARRGERGVSTWARTVLLREASLESEEERVRRAERLLAQLRRAWASSGAAAHADEVERYRAESWERGRR